MCAIQVIAVWENPLRLYLDKKDSVRIFESARGLLPESKKEGGDHDRRPL